MAEGKYEGLKALGSVLAGLGGLAALITVALSFWQEKPANAPITPTPTATTQPTKENQDSVTTSTASTGTSANSNEVPNVVGRERFFGTWAGAYGLEQYTITYLEDGTYQQRTDYVLLGKTVHTSGVWSFDDPNFSIKVRSSSDPFIIPVGYAVYGQVLESSQHSFVVQTQLIPGLTMVRQ